MSTLLLDSSLFDVHKQKKQTNHSCQLQVLLQGISASVSCKSAHASLDSCRIPGAHYSIHVYNYITVQPIDLLRRIVLLTNDLATVSIRPIGGQARVYRRSSQLFGGYNRTVAADLLRISVHQ
jgi:hypothetical protein